MNLTPDLIRRLPKVSLHDHLDGGLRPSTVLELSDAAGRQLPARTADDLERWFYEAADSGSLVRYLETFDHTIAVMQTAENLRRVAREYVEDLFADGVVYGETRWAPEQHLREGLTLEDAVEAVAAGLAEGMDVGRAQGRPVVVRQILTSMRHGEPSTTIAELVVRYRDRGVAGFDLAGAEAGFPPGRFHEALGVIHRHNAHATIHAGEAAGLDSIWDAVQNCGANRIGHGVRIVDDIDVSGGTPALGTLAAYVRDQRIPLEVCPTSNLQTGICASMAEHPIGRLVDLDFNVSVNCDNRLMSHTTLTDEFAALVDAFGYGLPELERFTVAAARAAFWPHDQRERLIDEVIRPVFAAFDLDPGAWRSRVRT